MRLITRFTQVAREEGGLEVLKKASRRIQSSVGLGIGAMSANLHRFVGISDRALMDRVEPHWNNVDEFIDHLRTKDSPAFPFTNETTGGFLTALREYLPCETTQTIQEADRICRHEFRVLGQDFGFAEEINWLLGQDFGFPDEINWHLDPLTGESWPRQYTGMMKRWFWTEKRSKDPLRVWALNRHQHFTTLGKAYVITGDEKYATECASQLNDWVEDNPRDMGINWFDPLEIAIRLVSWVFAFHLLRTSDAFVRLAGRNFIKSLYQQTRFLREHLTVDLPVPNNHLIGEVTALVLVGGAFPEFKDSKEWTRTGLEILEREIEKQTFDDGVNKEQSPSFHRFVLDFTLLVTNLSEWRTIREVPIVKHYTEKMLDYIMCGTGPDGQMPMIGDSGDIRGYRLSGEAKHWDFREKLAIGAVLYRRGDFKYVAERFGEEAFWLLGGRGLEIFERLSPETPDRISVSFPQGGYYIIRDDWAKSADFCLFRCGDFGLGGEGYCAHSHCDLLSFVLWIEGKPVIVDSGTYAYQGPWRDYFRLTSAHNTLVIDGKDQAIPMDHFSWRQIPKAISEYWSEDRVRGTLDIHGVMTTREIWHPVPGLWRVSDMLSGQGEHTVDWYFHLSPRLDLEIESPETVKVFEGDWSLAIKSSDSEVLLSIEEGWISPSYASKQGNEILHGRWQGNLSEGASFVWEIARI